MVREKGVKRGRLENDVEGKIKALSGVGIIGKNTIIVRCRTDSAQKGVQRQRQLSLINLTADDKREMRPAPWR